MVIAFCVIALLAAGFFFAGRSKDTELMDIVVYSLTGFFFSYIFFTALLLVPNMFSVKKASFLCMALWGCAAFYSFLKKNRASCSFSLRPFVIPIAASLIGIVLVSAVPYDYFGMGQDQGVFQTEAIMYSRGLTGKQIDIKEYHVAETESEKEQVLSCLTEPNLLGTKFYDETNIFKLLTGQSRFSVNEISQVFHGLHTLSALLALGAILFGIRHMVFMVTILFVLSIFWFCKIMRYLKIPDKVQAAVTGVFLISPQIIWCAKSTLTETGMILIWLVIIWLLLQKNSRGYLMSALIISLFGLYHVSLYIVMPLFVLIYFTIWLTTGDKSAVKAMILSLAGFLCSFVIDVLNNTDYTLKSYAPLFKGPICMENIFYIVAGTCILGAAAGFVLLKIKSPRLHVSEKFRVWAIRAALLLVPLYMAYRLILQKTQIEEFFRLTFPCLSLLAGIIIPLIVYADMMIHPARWTSRHEKTLMVGLYLYCVVFYSIVMIPQVQYCYYYSRYLCMYIPMILLAGALFFKDMKQKWIAPVAALVSIAILLPHSALLIRDKDDSRTQWDNLSQVEQVLQEHGAEAVFVSPSLFHYFYYDLKSLDIDVYPIFEDFEEESADIAAKYVRIYILDDGSGADAFESAYPTICRISNASSMDWELMLSKPFLLPNEFTKETVTYSVYEFTH